MRKLFLTLGLITLIYSCECKKIKYDIEVVYVNGAKDTITVKGNECSSNILYFHDECLYRRYVESKYEANFQDCVVCGIRSFRYLKTN